MSHFAKSQRRSIPLPLLTICVAAIPNIQSGKAGETPKGEEIVKQQFPVLKTPGVPPLVSINDGLLSRAFPQHQFFAIVVRQYPVARIPPEPLGSQNLFIVKKDGKIQHLKDAKGLEKFFRSTLSPVSEDRMAKEAVASWLRLVQEFKQDGLFKFSIPNDSLLVEKSNNGWMASGKVIVTEGGKGELRATLTFTQAGNLSKIEETSSIKAGIRPICQATKLLDPDAVVRQMAEKDILVMGQAAKAYLDEQRAKSTPELQRAIDRIWKRILDEGW